MGIGEPTGTNRNADGDLIGNRLFPVWSPMGTKLVTDGDQENGFAAMPGRDQNRRQASKFEQGRGPSDRTGVCWSQVSARQYVQI